MVVNIYCINVITFSGDPNNILVFTFVFADTCDVLEKVLESDSEEDASDNDRLFIPSNTSGSSEDDNDYDHSHNDNEKGEAKVNNNNNNNNYYYYCYYCYNYYYCEYNYYYCECECVDLTLI